MRPMHLAPLNPIGRPSGRFGRSKPQRCSAPRNPSAIRPLPFLSLLSLFAAFHSSLSRSDETERERARRWSDHGAVAGARAPQRVSTPPSSGLAAAPPWPSPASSCPPDRPFFSRAGEGPSRRTARFVPSPFPFSFPFPFFFSIWIDLLFSKPTVGN